MTWSVELNQSLGIVETVYSENVAGTDVRQAMTEAIALGKQNNVALGLIDLTNLEQACAILDIYDLPTLHSQLGLEPHSRIALILPTVTELHSTVEFYENVCVNRGWFARRFSNREDAVTWLLS